MTIIMIAHRLTTIASADNLLYFKSRHQLISAEKGSSEYDEIFEKLKCIQYAYGESDKENHEDDEDAIEDGIVTEVIEEVGEDDEDVKPLKDRDIIGNTSIVTKKEDSRNNSYNQSVQSHQSSDTEMDAKDHFSH